MGESVGGARGLRGDGSGHASAARDHAGGDRLGVRGGSCDEGDGTESGWVRVQLVDSCDRACKIE